jgi:hypothetical protein
MVIPDLSVLGMKIPVPAFFLNEFSHFCNAIYKGSINSFLIRRIRNI